MACLAGSAVTVHGEHTGHEHGHAGTGVSGGRARRDPLAVAAAVLAVLAFAGSYQHTHEVVSEHGQTGWIGWATAAMPEAMVGLVVLKISRARGTGEATAWAWLVGTSAVAFTVAANLATAERSWWGLVAAGWPAWASISALGLVHRVHAPADAQVTADTDTDTPAVTPVYPHPVTPVLAVSALPATSASTATVTVRVPAMDTAKHTRAATPASTPACTDADTSMPAGTDPSDTVLAERLRTSGTSTLRGAMRELGVGQARARRVLALAWPDGKP